MLVDAPFTGRFRRGLVGASPSASQRSHWLALLVVVAVLCGCAGPLPAPRDRAMSTTRVAPHGTAIADITERIGLEQDASGAWPLAQSVFALDARLAAIAGATRSIDVQTYRLDDDSIGRTILGALARAAARGVRVRLLLDDFHTEGLDPLLLGLAATPNAEVRVFNPFIGGRASTLGRLVALARDFRRLDHRMHNKLFVVDGRLAVVGGRNLADDYFLRGKVGNFFDVDLLLVGTIVPSLSEVFDGYWNSQQAYEIEQVVEASGSTLADPAERRRVLEQRTAGERTPEPPPRDEFGVAAFSAQLAAGRFRFVHVQETSVFADRPDKLAWPGGSTALTLARRFTDRLAEAESEVILLSPYFIPDADMMARLGELRARGVAVHIVTNSLAVSDAPFASIALERHQRELLALGVELYELSSTRLKLDAELKTLLGSSIGRLHVKIALVDRRVVYLGSLNLDGRSAHINTEIGLRLESAQIARLLFAAYRIEETTGVYRVKLAPDGRTLAWSVMDSNGQEVTLDGEPDAGWWHRLRVRLLSLFVPEGEL